MNNLEKPTMVIESSSKATEGGSRRRSVSACSNDSERNRKRRNICSKDKRKKSKRRSSSNSSSSSSASSPNTYKMRKGRGEDVEHKFKKYENGHMESQRRSGKYNNDYNPYKRTGYFQDNQRGRGYSDSRFFRHHGYDRNKRDAYNNSHYRYYNDKRAYYGNYRRGSSYSRSRTQDYHKGINRDVTSQFTRENSLKKRPKQAFSEIEKLDSVKDDTVGVEQPQRKARNTEDKAQPSRKKLKRKRSLSTSSVSSVLSTSSDSSSSSSSSSSSNSDSDSSSSTSTDSSEDEKKRKKILRKSKKLKKAMKKRKKKKRMKKKLKKKLKKSASKKKGHGKKKSKERGKESTKETAPEMTEKAKAMAPMTKEEWEKKQSLVRKVYDQETGRYRLIKGDGEVLEELVSRERHKEINRQATKGDGEYFQARLKMNAL